MLVSLSGFSYMSLKANPGYCESNGIFHIDPCYSFDLFWLVNPLFCTDSLSLVQTIEIEDLHLYQRYFKDGSVS